MQKIKKKIGNWLLSKIINWFKIDPHAFYIIFSNKINVKIKTIRDIEEQEARDNFRRFSEIEIRDYKSISEDIQKIDPKCIIFLKNNC